MGHGNVGQLVRTEQRESSTALAGSSRTIPTPLSDEYRARDAVSTLVEEREWIDGLAGPPALVEAEAEHGEMKVRRVLGRVARRADVADHLATLHLRAFDQTRRVVVEMRVVVGEMIGGIELVDRDAAERAVEELGDAAIVGRDHRRALRRHDVERLVGSHAAFLVERVAQRL